MDPKFRISAPIPIVRPPSIREGMWNSLSEPDRPEVVERVAFLVMRGQEGRGGSDPLSPAEAALYHALEGMYDEEEEMEAEGLQVPWDTVRHVAASMPLPWRRRDGRYTAKILRVAMLVERSALALAGDERHVLQDYSAEGLSNASTTLVMSIAEKRAEEIRQERKVDEVARIDDSLSSNDDSAHDPGSAD